VLGVAVGTVKSRTARALARLQVELRDTDSAVTST
jgi:DNA-directed RNA polymerase specialized sigma24 family protein